MQSNMPVIRQRRYHTAIDWKNIKQTIISFYTTQQIPIEEIIKILETEFNFKTRRRQLFNKFKEWRVHKYEKRQKPYSKHQSGNYEIDDPFSARISDSDMIIDNDTESQSIRCLVLSKQCRSSFSPTAGNITTSPLGSQDTSPISSQATHHQQAVDSRSKANDYPTVFKCKHSGQPCLHSRTERLHLPQSLQAGEIYLVQFHGDKLWYEAVLLPLGDFTDIGMVGCIDCFTQFFSAEPIPECYKLENDRTIVDWNDGYEEGGECVGERQYLVMYLDEGDLQVPPATNPFAFPRSQVYDWIPRDKIRLFRVEGQNETVNSGINIQRWRERFNITIRRAKDRAAREQSEGTGTIPFDNPKQIAVRALELWELAQQKNPMPEKLTTKKCPYSGCSEEFERACDLTEHKFKAHSCPWGCTYPGCGQRFGNRAKLKKHENSATHHLGPRKCTRPGCSKEFKRACDLAKHEKAHSHPSKRLVLIAPRERLNDGALRLKRLGKWPANDSSGGGGDGEDEDDNGNNGNGDSTNAQTQVLRPSSPSLANMMTSFQDSQDANDYITREDHTLKVQPRETENGQCDHREQIAIEVLEAMRQLPYKQSEGTENEQCDNREHVAIEVLEEMRWLPYNPRTAIEALEKMRQLDSIPPCF
ncbi:hypothetical protein F5Y08DRAFT_324248 [Xylaria arbuscula]|nr:hypothetical protein F5Y08DRAFT_324248 [Xylaria arbuscula]